MATTIRSCRLPIQPCCRPNWSRTPYSRSTRGRRTGCARRRRTGSTATCWSSSKPDWYPEDAEDSCSSASSSILDPMERPTSALHLTRVTLSLRQLGAEPHTKEVGHVEVYNHRGLRSACCVGGRGRVTARTRDTRAAPARLRFADD